MNSQKLLRKALDNPQGLRFAEALKLAKAFGFQLDRINGSHHILKRAGIPELSRGEQNRTSFVVSKTGISNGGTRLTDPRLRIGFSDGDPLPCSANTQRVTTPFDSRRRASGGDEFSSFNSRRRRSLRVTDSPRLCE